MNLRTVPPSIVYFVSFSFLLNFVSCRKGHLEPIGNSGSITSLHERDGFINPKEFLSDYVLKNRPVLMRKAGLDSPAITAWSDEYLRQKAKSDDSRITVEFGKKETRMNGTTLLFSEFLDTYNESDVYMVSAMPKSLEDDVIIPWPLQCEDYKRSFEDNVMWFSSGGTKSVIHHDGYENINCLLRGTKRFWLVNTTKYQEVKGAVESIIDVEDGSYGSVDVDKVDLDKYPVYDGLEFFKAEMNPGDCLYIPLLWIHQVQSWDSNIAVNMWWFSEINKLVDPLKCSDKFDHSATFKTANFHKTSILEDGVDSEGVVYAVRHAYARFLFKSVNRSFVRLKEFYKLITKGLTRKLSKEERKTVTSLFRLLDVNNNRKFDVKDLDREIEEDDFAILYQQAVAWNTAAKIHKCPLPVDLSDDSYKSVKPFKVTELDENASGSDVNRDEL